MSKKLATICGVVFGLLVCVGLVGYISSLNKPLYGFSGNVASLSTPTSTIANTSATGSLFIGSVLPSVDASFDLGSASNRWRNGQFSGALTVGSCTGCGGGTTFGKTWELINGALTPTTTVGIIVNASSTIAGSLNVTGNLNASSSLFVVGAASFASVSTTNDNVPSTFSLGGLSVGTTTKYLASTDMGPFFIQRTTGNVGVGTSTPYFNQFQGFNDKVLTIDSVAGRSAVMELAGNQENGGAATADGILQFLNIDNVGISHILSQIRGYYPTLTASSSGVLGFFTAPNPAAGIGAGDAPRMVINYDGNVGIATTTPSSTLSVAGNGFFQGGVSTTGQSAFLGGFLSLASSTFQSNVQFSGNVNVSSTMMVTGTIFAYNLGVAATPDNIVCREVNGANYGLLTDNSSATTCSVSSRKYKHDIVPLADSEGLKAIMQMNPVTFLQNDTNKPSIGFIAEEMQKIEPRVVFMEPDGKSPRGIDYAYITSPIVKAIQELDHIINGVIQKVALLTHRVDIQQAEIDQLKAEIKSLKK